MIYKIEDIYNQSLEDTYAITLDGEGYTSRMVYGAKIIRDNCSGSIKLLNTMKGGDYYKKVTPSELKVFLDEGWRCGAFALSLSNYRSKLDLIEQKIKEHITNKKSAKQIGILKTNREVTLKKYSEIKLKLNQLNYGKINKESGADNF